jgi:hypothetical protein
MAMEEDEGRGYCYAGRESTLKHMLCGGNFLTRPPTADTFHPPYPPIASQSISQDVPLARARVFGDRALHEHRRASSLPSHTASKLARFSFKGAAW